MSDEVVLCEVDRRGVATVTLNRPAVNNAYDGKVIAGLADAFGRLKENAGLRLVLLRGTGKHFQAGADLGFLKTLAGKPIEEGLAFSRLAVATVEALRQFPRPTIALVQGGCFGGGVGLVAACDMAIATSDAIFSLSEVRWGITPAPVMPVLAAKLGPRALGRFALGGERFNAAEALRMGLVHLVSAPGRLDDAAAPMIEAILMAAPEAVAKTKELIAASARRGGEPQFLDELAREAATRRHLPEAAEGLASFGDKRLPRWYPSPVGGE